MAMRHKPIVPKKHKRPKGKRRGAGEHHAFLSDSQSEALTQWQKDFQKAAPHIANTAAAAQRIFQELIDMPGWDIAETERPAHITDTPERPESWNIGHAKVHYVDRIERKGGSA